MLGMSKMFLQNLSSKWTLYPYIGEGNEILSDKRCLLCRKCGRYCVWIWVNCLCTIRERNIFFPQNPSFKHKSSLNMGFFLILTLFNNAYRQLLFTIKNT